MSDFADLDDGLAGATVGASADIKKAAHIANGGEATFACPKCNGSGVFRGYARTFPCFKCKGKGNVSRGVAAAAKGVETKRRNHEAWRSENADLLRRMAGQTWSRIIVSMLDQVSDGKALSERQIEIATDVCDKADQRDAERAERRAAEREEKATDIGVSAINALFETALNSGLKRPVFRAKGLVIKPAKLHADRLYVTDTEQGGEYVGKIEAGKFYPRREARAETGALLCEIASDPKKAALEYGRSTGVCGCCGRELTDPTSVAAGIGPICADNWGF